MWLKQTVSWSALSCTKYRRGWGVNPYSTKGRKDINVIYQLLGTSVNKIMYHQQLTLACLPLKSITALDENYSYE